MKKFIAAVVCTLLMTGTMFAQESEAPVEPVAQAAPSVVAGSGCCGATTDCGSDPCAKRVRLVAKLRGKMSCRRARRSCCN
ncbi:MAG: hypothetical protein P8L78_07925 [Mariniblastus sp.]|nr:hypothetical protein [Mariniblastus sp.]MDG2181604.1 hypothetical protein [Mariniblastus sp.]